MKRRKHLALVIFMMVWPFGLVGHAQETFENIASREGYRQMQLTTDGSIPTDGITNAVAWVTDHMAYDPDAWREFASAAGPGGFWTSIGPGNIGGRIRSIIIKPIDPAHPNDPRIIWLGAVEGGIWKSTDSGVSWTTNTDLLASLAVNCMAIDPQNPDLLYAGTGEGYGNIDAAQGNGIFVTRNGGTTWEQIPSTSNTASGKKFAWVNRIAIDPANSQVLLAATRVYVPAGGAPYGAIQRSTDGGSSWSQVWVSSAPLVNVSFRPRNQGGTGITEVGSINCLASSGEGNLYYSRNQGATWAENPDNGFPPPTWLQRLEVAYSRSNPDIVYALKGGVFEDSEKLYLSVNGGLSFTVVGKPYARTPKGGGTSQANWYANTLWVDPTDSNKLIAAGVDAVRSTDGGLTWTAVNSPHPDHHIFTPDPGFNGTTNTILYGANDGGIFITPDIWVECPPGTPCVQWNSLNHGLGVTQFYGAAGHAATGTIFGGTQDNGTVVYDPPPLGGSEDWRQIAFSDGGFCAIDQTSDPRFFGEAWSAQVNRGDGQSYSEPIWFGIPSQCGGVPCANFIAPLTLDPNPNGENRLLVGGESLWLTNNARAPYPTWIERKQRSDNYINTIALANGQPRTIWVGHNDGQLFYTLDGNADVPAWISGDPNHSLPTGRLCTRIVLGPDVYATFGGFFPSTLDTKGNVWKRNVDGSWTDISNNLPSCPIYALVVSPANPDTLYVGTEVGVFASVNQGQTWSPGVSGLPAIPGLQFGAPINTRVGDMFLLMRGTEKQLVIATHGRGVLVLQTEQ